MQEGQLFAGRYRLEQERGSGGMGVVWRARDERLGRVVALKTMSPALSHDPAFRRRFQREATAVAQVQHPGVVTLYDHAEAEGVLYAVFLWVDGPDLRTALDDGPLGLDRAVRVLGDVAAALDAAYDAGVLHRDVKPGNVLLARTSTGERALLTDFGLATYEDGESTELGPLLGTEAYLAPERRRGEQATRAGDVYSLARVLLDCVTGLAGPTSPDAERLAALPPELRPVVERALSHDPSRRPRTAGELAAEVRVAVAGLRAAALPPPSPDRTTELPRVPVETVTQPFLPPEPRPEPQPLPQPQPQPLPEPEAAARRRSLLVPALVVVGALLAGGVVGWVRAGDGAAVGSTRARAETPRDALRAQLPDSVYGDCRPRPVGEAPERPASLQCTPATTGVDELLVTQWKDPATMAADWQRSVVGGRYREAPCSSYEGLPGTARRSTWAAPGGPAPLACYINDPGAAIVMWEYPQQALQVRLVRTDGDYAAAFRWWREAKDVPLEPS